MTPAAPDRPDHIGPYRLLELLGEGGMGEVWLAEQSEPVHRRVALKIIKLGMDTKQFLARLEAERQALAVMSHPNIASFYDGGATETGRPYFVMELVRGVSITDYCDTHRLRTPERLRLFIDVCQAVQHAHHKGVIHRDLKPSNVLVTVKDNAPVVKIIDFGIAKALGQQLTDRTLVTRMGQIVGTPEYMSPEQAEMSGMDVDTRTDVYSLGVLLYELLVGTLPIDFGAKADRAIRHAIRETQIPRPSTRLTSLGDTKDAVARYRGTTAEALRKELRSDLDWIILKALEKDRTRRYDTANELGLELDRYLRHEPILARAPSTGYRVGRFIRRHRVGVAAAAAVAVALLTGLTLASVGMVRAQRAETRAAEEAEAARQVSEFLVELFQVSDPSEARGNTITAREILDRGAERIETELRDQPLMQARLLTTMGLVYQSLGLYREARPKLESALRVRVAELGETDPQVAASIRALGDLARIQGDLAQADSLLTRAVAIRESVLGPDDPAMTPELFSLGVLYDSQGRYEEAAEVFERVLEIEEAELEADDPAVGSTLNSLAVVYYNLGRYEESETLFRRSLEIKERALGTEDLSVAIALSNLGSLNVALNRLADAEAYHTRALAINARILGPDHPSVADCALNLASVLEDQQRYDTAQVLYRRAMVIYEDTYGGSHPDVGLVLFNLANSHMHQGKVEEAEPLVRRAHEVFLETLEPDHPYLGLSFGQMAEVLAHRGDDVEAEAAYRRAVDILWEALGEGHPEVSGMVQRLANLLEGLGRVTEADSLRARAAAAEGGSTPMPREERDRDTLETGMGGEGQTAGGLSDPSAALPGESARGTSSKETITARALNRETHTEESHP
jgi:non-specific serine/threonine protein kinase/serine/threonine-protein kinase